jgi:hypothetical protein
VQKNSARSAALSNRYCLTYPSLLFLLFLNVQIVFAVLGGWAIGITTAMKVFGGKKEAPAAEVTA